MTNKKYIIYPGYIWGVDDGQKHFIDAVQLARLYKVNLKECIIARSSSDIAGLRGEYICLIPKHSGKYVVPPPTDISKHLNHLRR